MSIPFTLRARSWLAEQHRRVSLLWEGHPLVRVGGAPLQGWIHFPLNRLPADFRALTLRHRARAIAVEDLEQLDVVRALELLAHLRSLLLPSGVLRVTTRSADDAWVAAYRFAPETTTPGDAALALNGAFRVPAVRFMWNRELLADALVATGFVATAWHRGGDGSAVFHGIESSRDETGNEGLHAPLVAEARCAAPDAARRAAFEALLERDFLGSLRGFA